MSSRSAATKKMTKPLPKPAAKAAKAGKPKLAKVTKFPTAKAPAKPAPAAASASVAAPAPKKGAPPPPPPAQAAAAKKQPERSQLPALTAPRNVQPAKQSLARSFYWSELRVGDDLPPLTKPMVDRVQIARYAAASGDFNRLHLDEPYAHSVGFPGMFAPGMLAMGFVGQLLTGWLRRGHVRKLSARFVKIVWPGDELTCRGRIAELRKENGGAYADVELWAENQKGELVVRGQATCELYESPMAGGGDGGGLLFALQQSKPSTAAPADAAAQRKPELSRSKPSPKKK
jgi:acyl dehydratase